MIDVALVALVALVGSEGAGVFCGDDHLIAQTRARDEPFTYLKFGLLGLVVIGRIDEIAALLVEEFEQLEDFRFAQSTHERGPGGSCSAIKGE